MKRYKFLPDTGVDMPQNEDADEAQTFPLIVEEQDEEWGFNIKFDRTYNVLEEKLPVDSNTAAAIMDDAYMSGYDPAEMGEVHGDMGEVGTVTVQPDGEHEIEWDGDAVDEVYGK